MAHKVAGSLLNGEKVFFNSPSIALSHFHHLFVFVIFGVLELEFDNLFEVFLASQQSNIARWDFIILPQHSEPLITIFDAGWQRTKRFTCLKLGSVGHYISVFGFVDLSN